LRNVLKYISKSHAYTQHGMGRNLFKRFLLCHKPGIAGNLEPLTVSSRNISSDPYHTMILLRCTIELGIHHSIHEALSNPKKNVALTNMVEVDMDIQLTTHSVGDFIFREYQPTKAGNISSGSPNKYSFCWRLL